MNNNDIHTLMLAVKGALLRHNNPHLASENSIQLGIGDEQYVAPFDVIDANTLRLPSNMKMYPTLKISEDGVALINPLAFYENEDQRTGLIDLFERSRQLWYNEAGWGHFTGAFNEPKARVEPLSEDIIFEDNHEQGLISARISFNSDYVLQRPDDFSSAIAILSCYPEAIRTQICEVFYSRMTKIFTTPAEQKSYFFCMLLLFYRINSSNALCPYVTVDWNDVLRTVEKSRQLIFYPSMSACSLESLATEMEKAYKIDVSDNEPYRIIVTITVPMTCSLDCLKMLRHGHGTNPLLMHIYVADNVHPYSAEMALLKLIS